MGKKLKFNPCTCRVVGWSALFISIVCVGLYIVTGTIAVPPESPLANPNFVIRELNDPTIRFGTELPPGTVTPINLLNNGEPIVTPSLIIVIVACVVCVVIFLLEDNAFAGVAGLLLLQLNVTTIAIEAAADILFVYNSLRAGAQPLIDGSHRLRVIVAYAQLWCERYDLFEVHKAPSTLSLIVIGVSYALAIAIEYRRWKREEATS